MANGEANRCPEQHDRLGRCTKRKGHDKSKWPGHAGHSWELAPARTDVQVVAELRQTIRVVVREQPLRGAARRDYDR